MRKYLLVFLTLIGVATSYSCSCVPKSCSNRFADISRNIGNSCFRVRLYSGGKVVAEYYTEYPNTMQNSDGWQFEDVEGKFIRLSRNVEIVEVSRRYCFKQ